LIRASSRNELSELGTTAGEDFLFFSQEGKGVIYELVAHPDKLTILLLGFGGHIFFGGGGIDVHRENVRTICSWPGISR
jgi:hypothetical protein